MRSLDPVFGERTGARYGGGVTVGYAQGWTEHPEEFDQVNIDPLTGAPCWPGDLDVAPDALYQDIAKPEGSAAGAKRHIQESLSPE